MPGASEVRVSVCMATYRGAAYVGEQLDSILDQLGPDDEVVVVDDASPDDTASVVAALADRDPRVRLFPRDHNLGYVRTFEEALGRARGRYLLLSDQDDLWLPGRVDAMVAALDEVDVVASNLTTLGGADALRGPYGQADWRLRASDSTRRVGNILGILASNRPYYGCAMGLRATARERALPFPPWLHESHDLWLALYGNVFRSMRHLPQRTTARRLHGDNQTPARPRSLPTVIGSRLMLVRCLVVLVTRRRRRRTSRSGSASA